MSTLTRFCRKNLLLVLTVMSVILGAILGFSLRSLDFSDEAITLVYFPGEMFMQVLKMMTLPLIFASLVSALSRMDAKESGGMGLAAVTYYLLTAVIATVLGIFLVLTIHPGDPSMRGEVEGGNANATARQASPMDTVMDMFRNMFPGNIVRASMERLQTGYVRERRRGNATATLRKKLSWTPGTDILGVIVFSSFLGVVMSRVGENARIVVQFFLILDAVIMRGLETAMWVAPLGIASLICGSLLEADDLADTAQMLFLYLLTVMLGLLVHTVLVMPGLYFIITRKNPLRVARAMLPAFVTAFGTASSGAALPVSMQCMEEGCGLDRRITRFVLPLGSTINMDGNALYEAVAVIFIAQLNGVTLSFAEVCTVSVTATVASIGVGCVPAGLVSILLILSSVRLPADDVSLIITVDWFIDRVRTAISVLGDGYAADAVAHVMQSSLEKADARNDFRREVNNESDMLSCSSRKPSTRSTGEGGFGGRTSRKTSRLMDTGGHRSWRRTHTHSVSTINE